MNITCRLDTRNFMAAHQILHRFARNPAESLHKAVGYVVEAAKDNTPVTTMSRIDTDLSVVTTPVLVTRGARIGLPLKDGSNRIIIGGMDTLAVKIILARLKVGSNYNILTDNRYAIDRATFSPGMKRGGFLLRLQQAAARMVKSRHSSTGFFKITWNPLLTAIADYVPARFKAHFKAVGGRPPVTSALGTFTPAPSNTPNVTCMIENNVGLQQTYPTLMAIRNADAHRVLGPVLQSAIDRNFIVQMRLIHERGLLDHSPELKALGVNIS